MQSASRASKERGTDLVNGETIRGLRDTTGLMASRAKESLKTSEGANSRSNPMSCPRDTTGLVPSQTKDELKENCNATPDVNYSSQSSQRLVTENLVEVAVIPIIGVLDSAKHSIVCFKENVTLTNKQDM